VTFVYDGQSRVAAVQHTCGLQIEFTYDSEDRVTSAQLPDGGTVSYGYDGNGDLDLITKTGLAPVTMSYDEDHAPLGMTGLGNHSPVVTEHDFLGRVTLVGMPGGQVFGIEYADFGHVVTVTSSDGSETQRFFDNSMRLTSAVDDLGRETQLEYEGDSTRPSVMVDPAGRTSTFEYDAEGQLVRTEAPDGRFTHVYYDSQSRPVGVTRTGLPDVFVVRDELGRIVKIHDQATLLLDGEKIVGAKTGSSSTVLAYDSNGEVASAAASGGPAWSVERDELGNPASISSPSGMKETRTFDDAGRVTGIERTDGSWVQLTYGATGAVESISTTEGSYELEVDATGEVTVITDPASGSTSVLRDGAGRVVGMSFPDGAQTSYVRDEMGRVVEAIDATGRSLKFEYDGAGRMTAVTSGGME